MAQLDKITEGVYRINTPMGDTGFSFSQFVIKDEKNALIHTGATNIFKGVTEKINEVVDIKNISYLFISHFESDECGALCSFLGMNASLKPVCPAVTARQLQGFGMYGTPQVVKPGDELSLGKRSLRFITYPSEMHLWDGLLAYEPTEKILFSSDLFVARGANEGAIKKMSRDEALKIDPRSIPSDEGRKACQDAIDALEIDFVAVGHGPVLDLRK